MKRALVDIIQDAVVASNLESMWYIVSQFDLTITQAKPLRDLHCCHSCFANVEPALLLVLLGSRTLRVEQPKVPCPGA